jgi:hypothetical protein
MKCKPVYAPQQYENKVWKATAILNDLHTQKAHGNSTQT